jgi:ABC-type Mn2+/Zn2+ transport system permease subunit
MIDLLLDPWGSGIGQRALVEVVLVGAVAGPVGFWVMSFRLPYAAESLSHGMLPGLVLASLAGAPLLAGAAGSIIVAALLIALAGRDDRIGPEAATAVAVTGLVGLGSLLALAPAVPPRLGELLFGDPLSADRSDLAAASALSLGAVAALAALHRPLAVAAFDPAGAASLRVRPGRMLAALLVLLALVLAVAARSLGSLLALAVIVAPAVAVRRHVRSPRGALVGGAAVAAGAGVLGLYASYHLDAAAGGCIALALCVAAGLGAALPRRDP